MKMILEVSCKLFIFFGLPHHVTFLGDNNLRKALDDLVNTASSPAITLHVTTPHMLQLSPGGSFFSSFFFFFFVACYGKVGRQDDPQAAVITITHYKLHMLTYSFLIKNKDNYVQWLTNFHSLSYQSKGLCKKSIITIAIHEEKTTKKKKKNIK